MWSRTPRLRRASSAASRIDLSETEKGEQGARETLRIASGALSWYLAIVASHSARMRSSSCTTESGGRPPSFFERDMEPRVGAKRRPSSEAAANWMPGRSSLKLFGIEIVVVGREGAAGLEQLGHGESRGPVDGLLVDALPYLVEVDEPVEELGVLDGGQGPGEGLVEVVVGVDEARA